ncbi:4-alpha-glucanotransferase, partial [Caballeronia sp. M23-90]
MTTPPATSGQTPPPPSPVEALAIKAGFEVEWQDAHKQTQRVPEATLTVLLERLGLPCGNAAQLKQSTATLDAELTGRKLPPLMTAEVDRAIALPVAAVKTGARYRIELESGAVIDGRFTSPRGETALLSPISEPGYHALMINEQRTTLAVAPARCYTVDDAWRAIESNAKKAPPMWGIATQVYGLRRTGDGGVGDYTALATL